MELDREASQGVQKVEEKIYQGTSASSIWPRQKKMRIEVDVLDYVVVGCQDR